MLLQNLSQMLDQQDQNQIQTRRNMMKAINYHEQLQLRMMSRVFVELKNNWTSAYEKYRSYYQMILYMKSFKGIMEYGMIQQERRKEAENQISQQSFRKGGEKQDNELQSEMKLLRKLILKRRFNKFIKQISIVLKAKEGKRRKALELLQLEKQEQEQNKRRQQEVNIKAKTQEAFNRRAQIAEKESDFKYLTSIAGNSRIEYSPIGTATRQINASRRKYVPIKALPPKPPSFPQFQSNTQINSSNKIKQQNIKPAEPVKIPESQQAITDPRQSKPSQQISNKRPSSPNKAVNEKEQQKKIENCRQSNEKMRQNNLAILSELKMIEIISINEIIEEYSQIFKRQPFSNEKNYIKQSIKLLEKIRLIE